MQRRYTGIASDTLTLSPSPPLFLISHPLPPSPSPIFSSPPSPSLFSFPISNPLFSSLFHLPSPSSLPLPLSPRHNEDENRDSRCPHLLSCRLEVTRAGRDGGCNTEAPPLLPLPPSRIIRELVASLDGKRG